MGKASAQPKNDDWKNAEEISIPDKGFGTGTFKGAPSTFKNASIELNESFDQVISSVALHQKSVWYKFTIPTTRNLSIALRQKDTLIQPLDIGMSVYLSDGFYPDKNDITGYLPSLSQQGTSSQGCLASGTYYIQVCARSRVKENVWVELKIDRTKVDGNSLNQPFDFSTHYEFRLSHCHSIESVNERAPFLIDSIERTAYLEFTTPDNLVATEFKWVGRGIGLVIYEQKTNASNAKEVYVYPWMKIGEEVNKFFRCGTFKSDTRYIIKICGSNTGYLKFMAPRFYTEYDLQGVSALKPADLGNVDSIGLHKYLQSKTILNCDNNYANNLCPSLHNVLFDSFWTYTKNGDSLKIAEKLTAGYWGTFYLEHPANINVSSISAYRSKSKVFLFKNKANKDPCELGYPIDFQTDNCIEPGNYTFLVAQNRHRFGTDTVWNAFAGIYFGASLSFNFPNTPHIKEQYKYPTEELAQNLGTVNKLLPTSKTTIQDDWLNGPLKTYFIGKDTFRGHFSFCKFRLDHESYIQLSQKNMNEWYGKLTHVFATNNQADLKKWTIIYSSFSTDNFQNAGLSESSLKAGEYCIVFYRPERAKCENLLYYKTNHYLQTLDSLPKKPPRKPPKPCINNHQWAKLAYRINNLNPLDENYIPKNSTQLGYYGLKGICTDSTNNLSNPLWVNYYDHRKDLPGFVYYVLKLDKPQSVSFFFNTHFQVLKGNISEDSLQTSKAENIIVENVKEYHYECYLTAGYYSIITSTDVPLVSGSIRVDESGYSRNDHAKFCQDLGFFDSNRKEANIKGSISCKTTSTSTDPVNARNTWHTFRAVGPAQLTFNEKDHLGFVLLKSSKGAKMDFNKIVQQGLIDSNVFDGSLESYTIDNRYGPYHIDILQKDTIRFYLLAYAQTSKFIKYNLKLKYTKDTLATSQGDSCQNAIPIVINDTDSHTVYTNATMHTYGEGIGEQKKPNWHRFYYSNLKSTWFKVQVKNGAGNKLSFSRPSNSNIYTMRVLYGNCRALTPGSVLQSNKSEISLDCIADGEYYIQAIEGKNLRGDIGIKVQMDSAFGLCKQIDLDQVISNFEVEGGCNGDSVIFTNYSSQGTNIEYEWDFGDEIKSNLTHPKHWFKKSSQLDTFSVSLIVSNISNGSRDTFSRNVVIGRLNFSAGNDTTFCGRTFKTNPQILYSGVMYEWFHYYPMTNNQPLSFDRNAQIISYADTQNMFLRISVGNCQALDTVQFFLPKNQLQDETLAICPNDSILIAPPKHWNAWITNSNQDSMKSIWILDSGDYQFHVLVNGCDILMNRSIEKTAKPPLPAIDSFCQNNDYQLYSKDFNRWIPHYRGEEISTLKILSNQNKYPITWKYDHNNNVCLVNDTLIVKNILQLPFTLKDTILCTNNEFLLGVDNAFGNFKWNTGDTTSSITVKKSGFYSLNYKDSFCSNFQEVLINFYPNIWTHIEDQKFCFDDGSAEVISNFDGHLLWSTGDTTKQITISSAGNYWLKEYDDYCTNTDSFGLTEYCPTVFYMPNAFTPNGDNINPEFIASGVDILKFEMTIYARNGQKVFYSKDMKNGWDGTVLGQEAPLGKYLYLITYETEQGEQQTLSGQFTLLR